MKKIAVFIPVFVWLAFFIFPSCQKEISPEPVVKDSAFIAVGSLKDTNNNCLTSIVYGTFYNGILPVGDTNYIVVNVNVATAGSYKISTDIQNGFQFADSGVFANTGLNTIFLKPLGTPGSPMITDFLVSFDTSFCFVYVEVKDSTGTGLGGGTIIDSIALNTWKFTASGTTNLSGNATGIFTTLLINELQIVGYTSTNDTIMQITVNFPTPTITPGTYTTGVTNIFSFVSITNGLIYQADASTGTDVVTIIISDYNSLTKIVTGTFSGTAQDVSGNSVSITNGAFKAVVN